jgi:hypothetical protein
MNMIDMRGFPVMGKARRGRPKGAKTKKAPDWYTTYGQICVRADIGTYETWGKQIGVERIDEARQTRRDVMSMLSLRNRAVDAGGRVTIEAAVDDCEHLALDPLRRAGIFDDPTDPERAKWRHDAGLELLRLYIDGKLMGRSTAAWRAVGGGGGGGVSAEEAEGKIARAEMKYHRAMSAVGPDAALLHSVCLEMQVPQGTKRSRLCAALDVLADVLLGVAPPVGTVRPRPKMRSQ